MGVPIIFADAQAAPTYGSYISLAVVFLELWVGASQWLVLHQTLAISVKWAWLSFVGSIFSLQPYFLVANQFSPSRAIFLLCLYPLLISLSQWHILRQRFQPAWSWVPASFFSLLCGGGLGFYVGIYIHISWTTGFGFSALVGGLTGGLVYSLITAINLHHITQQKYISPKSSEPLSKHDNPPDHKTWRDTVIISLPFRDDKALRNQRQQ